MTTDPMASPLVSPALVEIIQANKPQTVPQLETLNYRC